MPQPRNKELESKLLRLFQEKKLNSKDDLLTLFCKQLGFEHAETKLPGRSSEYWGDGQVAELVSKESFEILAQDGDPRMGGFAVIYGTLHDFNLSNQRTIILQLRKTFPDALYVFAKPQTFGREQGAQIDIVHARLRTAVQGDEATPSRLLIRRFRFGPGERYRTAAERLAKLALSALKSRTAAAITARCNDAFDKEALTNEFFKKLDQHIKAIESDLREYQHMSGPEAFSQAQLLIERLIFLYFAQNRGWLNQEPDYLVKNFADYKSEGEGFSYYHDFLHRLFHTLAEADFGNRLPGIPFLNGGLFDDDEFRLPASKLKIRNATFAELFNELLEAYNFTVREDTPLSQEVAVDPEMLGKIFESIVLHAETAGEEYRAPDKRKATGSYYTPRIVVHFICRESLRLYFSQRGESLSDSACRSTWRDRISRLFNRIDPSDGFSDEELKALKQLLSPEEARRCVELLLSMRTLDPAVGSGAFPVGLLHELISLQRIFETAMNGYVDPVKGTGTTWVQKAKQFFVQNALFGVDIQQQAVEICRLRLWLSLLVDYELGVNPFEAEPAAFITAIKRISQLPNLEMNFRRGDSLHDFVGGHPVRIELATSRYVDDLKIIENFGRDLHRAKTGPTRRKLRLKILHKRMSLAAQILRDEIELLKEQAGALADLFDGSARDREKLDGIRHEMGRHEKALKLLNKDGEKLRLLQERPFDREFYPTLRKLEGSEMDGPLNFAWRIDFPHVLSGASTETVAGEFTLINQAQRQQELTAVSRGKLDSGFDLIVGNPPFVTARNKEKRELYRERWPRVAYKEFQLVCPFFELGFSLLRQNGYLSYIVANAFATRDFGKPLLEKFLPSKDVRKIVDCSGLMFPGHGTPTCIVLGRQPSSSKDVEWKSSRVRIVATLTGGGDLRKLPEESPLWHTIAEKHDDPGFQDNRIVVADVERSKTARWPFTFDPTVSETVERLEKDARCFSDFSPSIGSMFDTHKDDVFFVASDHARRFSIEQDALAPFSIGDSIRDYQVLQGKYVLKPYLADWSLANERHFPTLFRYLRLFRSELGSRAAFEGGTYDEVGKPWFEYHQKSVEKITSVTPLVYPEIGTHAHFVIPFTGWLFTQTAPVVVVDQPKRCTPIVSGLLNSSSALIWLKSKCFKKREAEDAVTDTYFEFAGKKIGLLPIPAAIADTLRGKSNPLVETLSQLAHECWERGRELPSLALRKLFEKPNEAYHVWNGSMPGYVEAHKELGAPFSSTRDLESHFARAQEIRERLRREMIARQEEMDWLVYAAYGLITQNHAAVGPLPAFDTDALQLEREECPFRLWTKTNGDFEKAVALISSRWSAEKKKLWRARLEAIRDKRTRPPNRAAILQTPLG